MMKKLFALFLLHVNTVASFAQHHVIYNWNDVKKSNPDTIYGISFSKMKLSSLPNDLKRFHHLEMLDISKNKLTELPEFIGDFSELKMLDISKNKLASFPVSICRLNKLQRLTANSNPFDNVPECIEYCSELSYIEFWDTPINFFPTSFDKLTKLAYLDLRGVRYSPSFQENLRKRLPQTNIQFDSPCNCME
jgi:Leucine-rich repeat (LRR) protein